MQEALKKDTIEVVEHVERSVTLSLKSKEIHLQGTWSWDMQSDAVYCSDVMSFPEDFIGTKAIVHPDDLGKLVAALSLVEEKDLVRLDFRIITTYGEVKTVSGQRVSTKPPAKEAEPVPGKEPWQEMLEQIAAQKENDFLHIREQLNEYTERLHGIGSWLVNNETGQAWYSDNVFRIYKLAPQSLNPHANTFNEFIHKEDRIAVIDAFEKAFAEQAPLHIEYRIVTADGETKYVQQITRWFYSNTGQPVLSGVTRDVTEERELLDELTAAQSNTLLHKQILGLAEQKGTMAYWLTNLVTRKTAYSENYYRIYGFKQVTLPNYYAFVNLVHVDDRQRVRELVDKMFNEHVLPETEFRIVRPDGKIRYLKQTGKVFITQDKQLMMVGLVQDISVQKALEKKIVELNETVAMTSLVADMTEHAAGITSFAWLPDGYMQWSEGFYRFLGYKPGSVEPIARILYRNIHPDDLKVFRDAEALLLNHQGLEDIYVRFVSKGGVKQTKITFRPMDLGKKVVIALLQDISKQKEAELQFAQNKQYAELITDSVTDMILFTNVDHTVIYWNKVAEEMTGIRKEEALQSNLFDVLPRLNGTEFLGQLHLAVRGNEFYASRVNNCYLRKSQDYWLWPMKDETGEVVGVLHVVHDTSRQLELQQQLSERLNFIESLVEASVDRIVVLDRFMNYLYWNKKAEEYYAINKDRVLGKNILEIFPAFRNDPSYQQFRRVLKGETVYLAANSDDETTEYFETYLIPIKSETGDVTAVLWIVHDLNREYQLSKERSETAELLHATMDATSDMIQLFEAVRDDKDEIVDFRWILLNHAAEKWMPGSTGKSLLELQPGVVQEGIFDAFKEVVETGLPQQYEKHFVHEQFNGWFRQSVVKLNDGVATTTTDITDRKNAEQEVWKLKDEVAQKATDKYKAIFNSIDEGFAILEVVTDENGKVTDVIWREVNGAFEDHTGMKDVVGKKVSEFLPRLEQNWFDALTQVYKTGKPLRNEGYIAGLDRWFTYHYSRIGGAGSPLIAVVFNDIAERKQREQHQEFLLRFSDALRLATTADAVANKVIEMLFHHLQVDRCYISEVFVNEGYSIVRPECLRPGALPMTGVYQLSDYPETMRQLMTQPMVVHDSENDSRFSDSEKAMLALVPQRALLVAPLRKGPNQVIWALVVAMATPRHWTEAERLLLEDLAERTWAAVERAKAEEVLRKNQDELRDFNTKLEQQIADRTKELQKQLTLLSHTEQLAQSGSWEYEIQTGNFKWSEGMYRMFGLPQQMKVQPETYLDFAVVEDRAIAKKIVNHFKKKHEPFEEILRINRQHDIRTLKIKGSVLYDANEKPQKIIGVDVDITDVRKAEEKLNETRHWLQQTTKASPDSITIYDLRKKQPVYLNNCLAEWTGISECDLVEMGIEGRLKLIQEDDRLRLLHFNERVANAGGGEVVTIEYRISGRDGKTIWLRNRSKPFQRDSSGKVTHLLSILQNVSEEIELREQLKQRTQFAEAILDASVDRITVYDRDYRFVGWNKKCEQVHGKTKEQVIGKTIFEMFPGVENSPHFYLSQEKALRGQFVHVPVVKDGYTGDDLELFYIPLKNDAGETYAVVNVMHDVSDYVLSTEALGVLNKRLENKNQELEQKNEEITSFAFVTSHDMKEPLRKIHTFSDWLLDQEADRLSPKGKSYVEKIGASVHRMEVLIEDILVLTRIHSDPHREETVNLDDVLQQVKDDMSEQITTTATVIGAERLPVIKGNANQIFYLFKNLISNAIKFQRPGSVPHLVISSEMLPGIEVPFKGQHEEYLKLSFADNGFGFDQRYAKKIFQVFQRLHGKQEYEGTGIGLAICRKIMENHGGVITVESEPEKGSVFTCFFPLH